MSNKKIDKKVNSDEANEKIGILDPEGKYNNPLTDTPYSDNYRNLAKVWSKFPAYANPEKIIDDIKSHNVTLVVSGTGSGKTVLFPKYILHALNYKGKIAITLPKQIIAKSSAEFAADTLDVKIGEEVGYQYRNVGKKTFSDATKLLYCTDGTLVARLLTDPDLREFDAVVIDEAHERKVNIDFLLYLLRNVLHTRPEFKLIIMSATINQEIFKKYFKEFSYVDISIGAKTNYPIKSIFLDADLNINKKEYLTEGLNLIRTFLSDKSDKGGILFFVTSVTETNEMCELLGRDEGFSDNNMCIPVFSGMSAEQQKLATDKEYYRGFIKDGRKIIVATNVAESSITIEGITYVIDSGLELRSRFDPINRINILEKSMITQAQVKQRMGRTGRTGPGTCYHLYTNETYESMEKFPEPAIRIESIGYEIIRLLGVPNINNVGQLKATFDQFIEPPDKDYVDAELKYLKKINIITSSKNDGTMSDLGKRVSTLQMEPEPAIALMIAYRLNCFREVSGIIAMIDTMKGSIGELFVRVKDVDVDVDNVSGSNKKTNKKLIDKFMSAKNNFSNKYGDHIAILTIFKEYELRREDRDKVSDWCYRHFLKKHILENAYQLYLKMKHKYRYKIAQFNLTKPDETVLHSDLKYRVMASLLYGYGQNILHMKNGKIEAVNTDVRNIKIDLDSFFHISSSDNVNTIKMFYNQLFRSDTSPVKAKIVSKISDKSVDIISKL